MDSKQEAPQSSSKNEGALEKGFESRPSVDANMTETVVVRDYGHVQRRLQSRHIQFIALGGTIGTSLFLGIGNPLAKAGPASLLLGFTVCGLGVYGMMLTLGEMATWLPIPGAIPQYCSRFIDDAVGFAVGWNNWYFCAIVTCLDISGASIIVSYWKGAAGISPAVWIALSIILILLLNTIAVGIYGEAEFWFAGIKLITIVALLIMAACIVSGASPSGDRLGFRYWYEPGGMQSFPAWLMAIFIDRACLADKVPAMKELLPATGSTGRFLALFSVVVYAAFAFSGVEMVVAAGGETEDPRRNIPKAVHRCIYRIVAFYILGSLAVGCLVASDDPSLLSAQANGAAGAARSPWVVGITNAGIEVLPHIINAVVLTSALSSANAFLYAGSRYLYALAQNNQAPKIFLTCTKKGVPIYAVFATAALCPLTFLNLTSSSSKVFLWFANLTTIATLLTWICICWAFIRFRKAMMIQGLAHQNYWWRSRFQPYLAWTTMIFFILVTFFNGFEVFMAGKWDISDFLVAYIGIPVFFLFMLVWKIMKKTKYHALEDVDLITGKAEIDALEETWAKPIPRNIFERIWLWLA